MESELEGNHGNQESFMGALSPHTPDDCGDSNPYAYVQPTIEPPPVRRLRHVGGSSAGQTRSDAFASSGGGREGLGKNVNIHDPSVKSVIALDMQQKVRLKMATNAVTSVPDWNGTAEDWYEFSTQVIRLMANAGCDIVCRPEYSSVAIAMK